jgi:hypothetical protein
LPKTGAPWSVFYVAFSSRGWTDRAKEGALRLVKDAGRRRRWRPVGVRLLDLDTVDADLIRWSV